MTCIPIVDISKSFFLLLQARPAGDHLYARDGQQKGKTASLDIYQ